MTHSLQDLQRQFKSSLKAEHLNLDGIAVTGHFDTYTSGYWLRMEESLRDDFPQVAECLGDPDFAVLVRRALNEFPSRYSSLAEVSLHFVKFLRLKQWNEKYPFLADLGAFEWEKLLSSHQSWKTPQGYEKLLHASPDDVLKLRLTLQPSARLFKGAFAVHRYSNKNADKGTIYLLVMDSLKDNGIRELSELQYEVLSKIYYGETLGEILSSQTPEALSEIPQWFRIWAEIGLFISSTIKK
jgi:hypothetical protein